MRESQADIFKLIETEDSAQLELLLESQADLSQMHPQMGVTPLLYALYLRKPEALVQQLWQRRKARANLFEKAAMGDISGLKEILEDSSIDLNAPAADGFSALHLACYFGQAEIVALLLKEGADVGVVVPSNQLRPLNSAVAARSLEIVQLLLARNPEIDAQQAGGYSALHAAAKHGDLEIVRRLVEAGANPKLESEQGETAIDLAQGEAVKQLLQKAL